MTVQSFVFNQPVKHGKISFAPGVVYGFEDPDAAPYFEACGWGTTSPDEPVIVVSMGELDIDPATTFGSSNYGALRDQPVLSGSAV